jgi:hypothetical protein
LREIEGERKCCYNKFIQDPDPGSDPKLCEKSDPDPEKSFRIHNTGYLGISDQVGMGESELLEAPAEEEGRAGVGPPLVPLQQGRAQDIARRQCRVVFVLPITDYQLVLQQLKG